MPRTGLSVTGMSYSGLQFGGGFRSEWPRIAFGGKLYRRLQAIEVVPIRRRAAGSNSKHPASDRPAMTEPRLAIGTDLEMNAVVERRAAAVGVPALAHTSPTSSGQWKPCTWPHTQGWLLDNQIVEVLGVGRLLPLTVALQGAAFGHPASSRRVLARCGRAVQPGLTAMFIAAREQQELAAPRRNCPVRLAFRYGNGRSPNLLHRLTAVIPPVAHRQTPEYLSPSGSRCGLLRQRQIG